MTTETKKARSHSVEKYVAPEFSIAMEYVFNPFYEFVAKFYPQWWTPNGITLFGITCTLLASLLFFTDVVHPVTNDKILPRTSAGFDKIYDIRPVSFETYKISVGKQQQKVGNASATSSASSSFQIPASFTFQNGDSKSLNANSFVQANDSNRFIFILSGILNLIYIIADNTDGKHARRWKKSSAIGEYLDHGLDMISALLSCFVVGAAAGERLSIGFPLQCLAGLMMVFSHFHNYDKKEFIWGDRLFSVDEAMVLIAVYPLVVGIFPSLQDVLVPGTSDLRVVQLFMYIFIVAMIFNCLGFIKRNRNTVNILLGFALFSFASMVGWALFHQGGMQSAVQNEMTSFTEVLAPYLAWSKDHSVSTEASFTFPENPSSGSLPSQAVKTLYTLLLQLCPPYMLRVIGSRVLKLFTCYPALWSITTACAVSTIVHVPIAAKCMKIRTLSYVPLAGVLLMLYVFGVSPILGTMLGIAWHLAQIIFNCASLQSAANAAKKA